LQRNRQRDAGQARELRRLGWRVLTVWECETKDLAALSRRLRRWFEEALALKR
jgi:DNA mismatch endonuclease (patch repair protein)